MDIYYKMILAIFRAFHVVTFQQCRVSGTRDFPEGAKIVAGNHPNATDAFFLPFIFPEQLYFFVQGDLFSLPVFGWLFAKSNQIRVVPDQKYLAFEKALRLLRQDKPVALFPEATLNPDGQPLKSTTGAVRLSLMTKTPIIPVGFYVPPKNLHFFRKKRLGRNTKGHWQLRGRCYLHIGLPWVPSEEAGIPAGSLGMRVLTERLMRVIDDQVQMAMQAFVMDTGQSIELASFSGQ